jgi:hypothetical protein
VQTVSACGSDVTLNGKLPLRGVLEAGITHSDNTGIDMHGTSGHAEG